MMQAEHETSTACPTLQARILHTMLRVGDMQRSIDFYTRILSMKVLRTLDNPDERYSLTFLGYQDESTSTVLELTFNYDVTEYVMGTAYGHIAIGVTDIYQACKGVWDKGGKVLFGPEPLQGSDELIAFIADPDGYQLELIERPATWF